MFLSNLAQNSFELSENFHKSKKNFIIALQSRKIKIIPRIIRQQESTTTQVHDRREKEKQTIK
jgi:hypothetical protein